MNEMEKLQKDVENIKWMLEKLWYSQPMTRRYMRRWDENLINGIVEEWEAQRLQEEDSECRL